MLKSEIWFDGKILAFSAFMSRKFYFKKGNLHSFTTPRVYPTKAICSSSWINFTHMCLVVTLSFIKLCDPSEMPFILVWSRSCAPHQLNFYTGSQLCHSIHPQNKTPMISLSSIFQMRHGLLKKRKKREKMAWPRSMTQKKREKNGHINVH